MGNNNRACGVVMTSTAAIILLLVPSSVLIAQRQADQPSMVEPSPEINGGLYMSTTFVLEQDSNSFKASNGGVVFLPFERKNLTGFQIVPSSEYFTYGETSIYWSADIKIPIDQTKTVVKDLLMLIDVSEIERRLTVNGTPTNLYTYSGFGTLSIGESKWNVAAKFEPEYQTALLRLLSI